MEGFFGVINDGLVAIDDFIWGVPLMVLILFGGILLTVRLRAVQFRQLPRALRYMIKNETGGEGEVTSFGALCTALSATIGTGNIVGVATAIVAGGPGALFWMWLAALFGMATKFSEGLLAVKYRSIDKKTGHVLGGPFYYIERGMGKNWRWLAKIFAFFGMCVGLFGIGTFTQVNSISSAITGFFDPEKNVTVNILGMDYSIFTVIGSLLLALLVGLVVIGGLKRIAKVSERVIPAMVVLYVGFSLILIITNLDKVPTAFVTIFESAFGLQAAAGGMLGAIIVAMQKGIARGIFSNEAGLGSAPIAAAAAQTKEPVRQGLVSMTGTFLDTIVVCSMTGLALVMTGAYQIPGLEGAAVTTAAFQAGLPFIPGDVVSFVLMACLVLFGFTTILGWDYYGERCLEYFSNGSMKAVKVYRWLYIAAVFIGPYMTVAAVWTIADIFNGLMALPNMVALIALSGVVAKETKDYFARLKAAGDEEGMEPHLPGDNWDIPPIDPLEDRLGAAR
ncbi:alanine/glycine:cation symporter family protein [Enteroscipio rubneri]|uniref:Sodium:alanine symporter family protein n=1 Tax=Enteroscipio rubneri TaxID=2070686 RepID=A0A2K2UB17_9ACTN|nr:sodium:alanine symporter family protein [Enteroscipio rubneri]PNV67484.1 sodium:alanine symporter family protein [Enteroscipio rubneri]